MFGNRRDRRAERARAEAQQAAAEAAYWAADNEARDDHLRLADTADPHHRAKLLRRLAGHEIAMARYHYAAFGPEPLRDEGGRDMADSLANSAALLGMLGHVEYAVAVGRPRLSHGLAIEHAAEDVLDRMAAESDLYARMRLLEELADAVEPLVGVQAAECVACLPAPGMSGWLTLEEHRYGAGIAEARRAALAEMADG